MLGFSSGRRASLDIPTRARCQRTNVATLSVRGSNGTSPREASSQDRLFYRLAVVLAILPIIAIATWSGLHGWIPTADAAGAVIRAKYSLGSHTTLLGMQSWPTSKALGVETYYLGPWQLWWLWLPIRLFGTSWGPLAGMAVLNSGWILVAAVLTRRYLGERFAALVITSVAVLLWALGAATFSSPVPVVATVLPLAVFLTCAWLVALGDSRSLPWFVTIASFLILSHPQTTVIVLVVGTGTLVIAILELARVHHRNRTIWSATRRRWAHVFIVSLVATALLWTPPVVQQFTTSPGNLTNMARGVRLMPPSTFGPLSAIQAVTSLFDWPRFWFRHSTQFSPLTASGSFP